MSQPQKTIHHPKKITLGTDQDPFNKPELEHTLKGRELYLFVLFYTVAVLLIVMMFEFFMPVLFNPNYPNID
uniref:Cytochrome bc complex cytochrome b subunit n=1 Tax=Heterorhabditis bacteriophora TaxID=37862 RepID=A0A1I7XUW3_HETBA